MCAHSTGLCAGFPREVFMAHWVVHAMLCVAGGSLQRSTVRIVSVRPGVLAAAQAIRPYHNMENAHAGLFCGLWN